MIDASKLNNIDKMMKFLSMDDFVIPDFGLPWPPVIQNIDQRQNRLFRLSRYSKTMSYTGWNNNYTRKICIYGIAIPETFITRAYVLLKDECKKFVAKEKKTKGIQNIKYLDRLLFVFGGVSFLVKE